MSDLISRQDIKYHVQLEAMGNGQYEEVEIAYKNDIESLPSADAVQIPIKLEKRYPQSRDEDITDAFMRGYLAGRSSADRPTGWIPVSEKLPENSRCVLISIAGDIEFGAYDRQNSDWAIWRDGYWDEGKRADAWMPLKPYREDGEA